MMHAINLNLCEFACVLDYSLDDDINKMLNQ